MGEFTACWGRVELKDSSAGGGRFGVGAVRHTVSRSGVVPRVLAARAYSALVLLGADGAALLTRRRVRRGIMKPCSRG